MLTNSLECLIWGEAGGGLDYLSNAYQGYQQMLGPGNMTYKFGLGGNGMEQFELFQSNPTHAVNAWIASMNPPETTLRDSFRQFLDSYYGQQARVLGYSRWGVKEVRSGPETASFMKILYPEAKFIFLVRNPFNCLLSIKRRNWMGERNALRATANYTRHWRSLAKGFRNANFGLVVRYEDILNDQETVHKLRDYLEIGKLDSNFAENSRADWTTKNKAELSFFEKRLISAIAKDEIKFYGY